MFEPGTLWARAERVTAAALGSGDLQPIPTDLERLDDGGMRFVIRVVSNLARKDQVRRAGGERTDNVNPFLPYDPALYVADASASHVCLLNKFPVVRQHLLIVTREFEPQEAPLNGRDFSALWRCLREGESLGFYNAGTAAGASQPHKHLQLVPLPLAPGDRGAPLETLIEQAAVASHMLGRIGELPCLHALVRLEFGRDDSLDVAARHTLQCYLAMLEALELLPAAEPAITRPHNLLVTRRWMLVVPRSQERVRQISLNALAFAGTLLVRNREELEFLKACGPMAALRQVTVPPRAG